MPIKFSAILYADPDFAVVALRAVLKLMSIREKRSVSVAQIPTSSPALPIAPTTSVSSFATVIPTPAMPMMAAATSSPDIAASRSAICY